MAALHIRRGSLSEAERLEIESHVTHTFQFLVQIPWTQDLASVPKIAYAHHERLNGKGYPRQLTAPDIPLQSKAMAIADIFDALTAQDRPYKAAVPWPAAWTSCTRMPATGTWIPICCKYLWKPGCSSGPSRSHNALSLRASVCQNGLLEKSTCPNPPSAPPGPWTSRPSRTCCPTAIPSCWWTGSWTTSRASGSAASRTSPSATPSSSGHFPQKAVFPGVLIVEAMAQTGGCLVLQGLADRHSKLLYFMAIDKAKFRRPVVPGDQMVMDIEVISQKSKVVKLRAMASVGGQKVAEAELMSMMVDVEKGEGR